MVSTSRPGDSARPHDASVAPRGGGQAAAVARFVVTAGPDKGKRFDVQGQALVGRGGECRVLIDDPEMSRHHAELAVVGGSCAIADAKSTNGTWVNRVRVERSALAVGDTVQMGTSELSFVSMGDEQQARALQKQRLEMAGRMAAGVAHDFNNMLAVASACLASLRAVGAETPLGAPVIAECLFDLRQSIDRARELASGIVGFSRAGSAKHAQLSVSSLCEQVVGLVQRTPRPRVRVAADIEPGLDVMGSEVELMQAVMNLCLNAIDAMPDGGTLTVRAEGTSDLATDGASALVTVSDTGTGMDSATVARIFEPFFTTKAPGLGAGLGLASVREIVDMHGGAVEVSSTPGVGTTFVVRLPRSSARRGSRHAATVRRAVSPAASAIAGRRVLVVDAEPMIGRMLVRTLAHAGCEARAANDGAEALLMLDALDFDAIVLAVDLQHVSGEEVLRALRSRASAPAVVVTGHPERLERLDAREHRIDALLAKPIDPPALLLALGRILTSRTAEPPTLEVPTDNTLRRALPPGARRPGGDDGGNGRQA